MIKGVIFDMDGVISDTQKFHAQVESSLLARFGIKLSPEEITNKYSGVRTRDFFEKLLCLQDEEYDIDALMAEKWNAMEKLSFRSVDAIPGAIDLIKKLHEAGYPMAVASASNLLFVDSVLNMLGIKDYFSAVISGDMVRKGKPDPESFLMAAPRIGVVPDECLVIEDGVSGMEAALAAGMKCIGLVSDVEGEYPTNNLVKSLTEVDLDYLERIK